MCGGGRLGGWGFYDSIGGCMPTLMLTTATTTMTATAVRITLRYEVLFFSQCVIGLKYTASAGEMYRVPSAPFELQTG